MTKRETLFKTLFIIAAIAAVIIAGLILLRNAEKNALQSRLAGLVEGENAETLKRLNAEWTLPEGHTLETVETGGLRLRFDYHSRGFGRRRTGARADPLSARP